MLWGLICFTNFLDKMTTIRAKLETLKISTNDLNKNINSLKVDEINFSKRLDIMETMCKNAGKKSKFL